MKLRSPDTGLASAAVSTLNGTMYADISLGIAILVQMACSLISMP